MAELPLAPKREPNLTQRLRQLFAPLPATATMPPRQLNACIDGYNTVRDTCHVQTE